MGGDETIKSGSRFAAEAAPPCVRSTALCETMPRCPADVKRWQTCPVQMLLSSKGPARGASAFIRPAWRQQGVAMRCVTRDVNFAGASPADIWRTPPKFTTKQTHITHRPLKRWKTEHLTYCTLAPDLQLACVAYPALNVTATRQLDLKPAANAVNQLIGAM